MPIPLGTPSKSVVVQYTPTTLRLGLKGQPPVRSGALFSPIKLDDCVWTLEDRHTVGRTLVPAHLKQEEWWPHVGFTERQIDMKTLKPPSNNLRGWDEGAPATVRKMMLDQQEPKRKGLRTSDERTMQEMFQRAHPHQPPPLTGSWPLLAYDQR